VVKIGSALGLCVANRFGIKYFSRHNATVTRDSEHAKVFEKPSYLDHTDGLYTAYGPCGAAIKTIWIKFFLDEKTLCYPQVEVK